METSNINSESDFLFTKEMFIQRYTNPIEQDYSFQEGSLGEGAFGSVCKANKLKRTDQSQDTSRCQIADETIETLSKSFSMRREMRAIKRIDKDPKKANKSLIENEIEILSYLDHPLIVKLFAIYECKGSVSLVQDLLEGDSLYSIIEKENKLSEADLKYLFKQIIRGLRYLHSQNICHRDLKLENIVCTNPDSFQIKIIDFGLAFCWEEEMKSELKKTRQNKKLVGTYDYMSPEMIAHDYDQRSDIWAAGVILYMLVSKTSPFDGSSDREIVQNIRNINYSLKGQQFEGVNEDIKDLISRIFLPEDQRISLSEILSHQWLQESEICKEQTSDSVDLTKDSDMSGSETSYRKDSQCSSDSLKKLIDLSSVSNEENKYKLTFEKINFFNSLPAMKKFTALFSVFNSNETDQSYGEQFMKIDADGDGSIGLDDFCLSLEKGSFSLEEVKMMFHALDMNKRDSISYSQYLACVKTYQKAFTSKKVDESSTKHFNLETDSDCQSRSVSDISSLLEDSFFLDFNEINQFFELLDRKNTGQISKKDLQTFFILNGLLNENQRVVDEMGDVIISTKDRLNSEKSLSSEDLVIRKVGLPNSYKGDKDGGMQTCGLPNTYKGGKDGGIFISLNGKNDVTKSCRVKNDKYQSNISVNLRQMHFMLTKNELIIVE